MVDHAARIPGPARVFGIFAAYFLLQTLIRLGLSESVDLDEAEQLVYGQQWRLAYGAAPPLYTWLQKLFFLPFGESVLALALLKNLLLFGTVSFTYLNARFVSRDHFVATAAAFSLLFIPQISWESQRDLTHSVLASTLAAAALWTLFQVCEHRRNRDYLMFGFAVGTGLLSKYNFALWVLVLVCSALTFPGLRKALLHPKMVLALAAALLVVAPHGWALWSDPPPDWHGMSALAIGKEPGSWVLSTATAAFFVLRASLSFIGPIALVYALVLWATPPRKAAPAQSSVYVQSLLRSLLMLAVIVFVMIAIARPTDFRERWFLPMAVSIPVILAGILGPTLNPRACRRIMLAGLFVMVIVALALPARILVFKLEGPLLHSYQGLAVQLRPLLPPGCLLVGEDLHMAGNLRLAFPEFRVVSPESARLYPIEFPCVLVWSANRRKPGLPKKLQQFIAPFAGELQSSPPQTLEVVSKYRSTRVMRWGVSVLRRAEAVHSPSLHGPMDLAVQPRARQLSIP